MPDVLESYKREYFTTARNIHDQKDWFWVNPSPSWHFATEDEAQSHANLSNENGKDSGLDILNYPYFVVKVIQHNRVEEVA